MNTSRSRGRRRRSKITSRKIKRTAKQKKERKRMEIKEDRKKRKAMLNPRIMTKKRRYAIRLDQLCPCLQ
jgi:hypothetical protein